MDMYPGLCCGVWCACPGGISLHYVLSDIDCPIHNGLMHCGSYLATINPHSLCQEILHVVYSWIILTFVQKHNKVAVEINTKTDLKHVASTRLAQD
jgi:hypothetical protein